jgi:hypothetical protein
MGSWGIGLYQDDVATRPQEERGGEIGRMLGVFFGKEA